MFRIEKALNQTKKTIPLSTYRVDRTIQRYLGFTVQNPLYGTVRGSAQNLIAAMRNRDPAAYNVLTRSIGNKIASVMGW